MSEAPSFNDIGSFEQWYDGNFLKLEKTCAAVERLVASELDNCGIQYLPILKRIKTKLSSREKLKIKISSIPYEMTDLIGIRVVVLLEHDIDLAAEALHRVFSIDLANCIDKRKNTKVDSVGYRSLHLVASLGETRAALPEYRGICNLKFEIQIRTALQHTWAEIEHKRNYKGEFALPPALQRRLMVLSGTLELIDREFSQISLEASEYKDKIENSDSSTQDDAISYFATLNIIHREIQKHDKNAEVIMNNESHDIIARELTDYGVDTIGKLEKFLQIPAAAIIAKGCEDNGRIYAMGFVRDLMICDDVEKYFQKSFKGGFTSIEIKDLGYLKKASGKDDIARIITSHGVDIIDI